MMAKLTVTAASHRLSDADPGQTSPTASGRGRQRNILRALWGASVVLTLALFVGGIPAYFDRLQSACAGPACVYLHLTEPEARALREVGFSLSFYAAYLSALTVTSVLAFLAAAAVLFRRGSDNRMAVFVSLLFVLISPTFFLGIMEALIHTNATWRLPVSFVQALGLWLLITFGYVFPDGRCVPRWTRALVVLAAIVSLVTFSTSSLRSLMTPDVGLEVPLSRLLIGLIGGSLLAQIYRYRRVSGPAERRQAKWVVFGFAIFALASIGYTLAPGLVPSLNQPGTPRLLFLLSGGTLNVASLLLFLLTFSVAVLRYQLFDIDVIIRRTLVYGMLTALLALVYVGTVVVLQGLFRGITGEGSDLAIVASTLAIAALSQPLKRRVQGVIDRRFYRRTYDAGQVLATFGARARDEVDLAQLTGRLVDAVEEAMQPEHVSLWLRKGTGPPK